ncbi:MAG: hypothetical protein M0R05_00820 [Bacilli bacterium]|nr:hypothetical protein [Bacilli bacterium]MDD4076884.1 hypothetical protein [Bacilli bacterium]MDD4387878.1 hypothetical protein [Bacilli bacterium]
MMFLLTAHTWTIIILAICVLPIMVLMLYALIMTINKRRQQTLARNKEIKESTDNTQKELFYRLYGGEDNIVNVTGELSRISVQVKEIDKVLVEELKETGAKGVLLVNDIVKCSFGDRASYIYKLLNKETK